MSTNSRITLKKYDNEESIYCHFDGGIGYVGRILFTYYDTYDKVLDLISYGDLSSLGKTISECVFFHRDMGMDKILNNNTPREYNYLFTDKWLVWTNSIPIWYPLENYFIKDIRLNKIKKLMKHDNQNNMDLSNIIDNDIIKNTN